MEKLGDPSISSSRLNPAWPLAFRVLKCGTCGVRQVYVPWARAGGGVTPLFERRIKELPADLETRLMLFNRLFLGYTLIQ